MYKVEEPNLYTEFSVFLIAFSKKFEFRIEMNSLKDFVI